VHLGYVSFCSVMGDHGSVVRPHEARSLVGRIAVGDCDAHNMDLVPERGDGLARGLRRVTSTSLKICR